MEDDLKKTKKRRQPQKQWNTDQSTKINLIGCDTIVNSPSLVLISNLKLIFPISNVTWCNH
jgi:hypothetical protein